MTNLTIKAVEYVSEGGNAPELLETATVTQPLSAREIAEAISDVVARADETYALDVITMFQVKKRIAEDAGERVTLDDFAHEEGWGDELAQLRSE